MLNSPQISANCIMEMVFCRFPPPLFSTLKFQVATLNYPLTWAQMLHAKFPTHNLWLVVDSE